MGTSKGSSLFKGLLSEKHHEQIYNVLFISTQLLDGFPSAGCVATRYLYATEAAKKIKVGNEAATQLNRPVAGMAALPGKVRGGQRPPPHQRQAQGWVVSPS